MFKKTLITLAAVSVFATAIPATSFAMEGGGGGSDRPYAYSDYNGEKRLSVGTNDGGRLLFKKKKGKKIRVVKKHKKSRPWAASRDTRTGRSVISVGNGAGNPRTVITITPFGIGFGFSN